jgi:hypothetical protein
MFWACFPFCSKHIFKKKLQCNNVVAASGGVETFWMLMVTRKIVMKMEKDNN